MDLGWLDIVLGCLEVELNIGLNAANLIIRLGFDDVDGVVAATILDINRVTLVKHGVMRQFLLENGLGVRQVDERCLVRLDLDIGTFL